MQPPCRQRNAGGGAGFTLIELLITVGIMALLAGMLAAMLQLAQRTGRIANTRSTLMLVDQAIRLFRVDMRIYPWQTDLGTAPAEPAQWGNDLAFRLAWDPPPAGGGTPADPDRITYIGRFHEDVAAIQQRFRFVDGGNVPPSGASTEGSHAFRNEFPSAGSRTNLLPAPGSLRATTAGVSSSAGYYLPGAPEQPGTNDATSHAQSLSRMAEELCILAYTAGSMPVEAPQGIDPADPADKARFPAEDERYPGFTLPSSSGLPFRYVPYNRAGHYGDDRRGPVLTAATAKAAGWRGDYLADAIGAKRIGVDAGGTMLMDAWGRPLIYVCRVRPGVRGYLHALDRTIWSGAMERRYNMGPQGRDPTTALASDIRTAAAPSFCHEFELWSAGPDGRFAGLRSDAANADNLPVQAYGRELR